MKITTTHMRATKQIVKLDTGDLRHAAEDYAREHIPTLWMKVPPGCVEQINVDFGDDEDGDTYAEVIRTFTEVVGEPKAAGAVDPVEGSGQEGPRASKDRL